MKVYEYVTRLEVENPRIHMLPMRVKLYYQNEYGDESSTVLELKAIHFMTGNPIMEAWIHPGKAIINLRGSGGYVNVKAEYDEERGYLEVYGPTRE